MLYNLNSAIRWGLADGPPNYPPLSSHCFWPKIRQSSAFRALNLLFDAYRLTSLKHPATPSTPLRSSPTTYARSLKYHLTYLMVHFILLDISTFIPYFLISPDSPTLGVSVTLARLLWAVPYMLLAWNGECLFWHGFAILGIGSGLYGGDEWSRIMDKPWRAESVNDFWGRRWHNLMTVCPAVLDAQILKRLIELTCVVGHIFKICTIFRVSTTITSGPGYIP